MQNMLGAYGNWAADTIQDPPRLSFRQPMFTDVGAWRPIARSQFHERLMQPGGASTPVAAVLQKFEFDGLSIEHLQWQLPFGPPDGRGVSQAGRLHRKIAGHRGPA